MSFNQLFKKSPPLPGDEGTVDPGMENTDSTLHVNPEEDSSDEFSAYGVGTPEIKEHDYEEIDDMVVDRTFIPGPSGGAPVYVNVNKMELRSGKVIDTIPYYLNPLPSSIPQLSINQATMPNDNPAPQGFHLNVVHGQATKPFTGLEEHRNIFSVLDDLDTEIAAKCNTQERAKIYNFCSKSDKENTPAGYLLAGDDLINAKTCDELKVEFFEKFGSSSKGAFAKFHDFADVLLKQKKTQSVDTLLD